LARVHSQGGNWHSSRRIKIYFEMYEIWLKAKKRTL
jgi:hypothetical protein